MFKVALAHNTSSGHPLSPRLRTYLVAAK
ncbi:hypothetical protein OOU_Y34scaffold00688g1 [Pyricularia oryzae Y34]|uniref:Uncharacterized protein n=2 Tax=Pyricularia oryzae TaxID=318829 RepID=A0AA97NSY1_PYRO3|nr:hypothetical protein OOU_Y34scaffold00688g1 [Pyricularia oryzae Y34]